MIDVVIVAYESRSLLAPCIGAARGIPDLGRVVVVDHGRDGSGDLAEALGAHVLRDPGNPGFGAGQNSGVTVTTAPYLLLLNPDAEVDPDAVARGVELLDANPLVAAVQGSIIWEDRVERSQGRQLGAVHLWGRALAVRRLLALRAVRAVVRRLPALADHVDRLPDMPTDVESLAATALLVRRDALLEVGGFASGYFLYGEDLDLCRRLRGAGWRLVAVPDPWASHLGGASSSSSTARELEWWRGTMTFAAKWWSPAAWRWGLGAAWVRWARLAIAHPARGGQAWRALVGEPRRTRRSD